MPPSQNNLDILIVDDNPANLQLLTRILQEQGYRVRAATSGPRALASAALAAPELVLLDIRMPEMDGYEVCRRLKADPATRDIPVLFISALDDVADKIQAFGMGAVDYVTKPFQVEEVLARVETHLTLHRLQANLREANRRMEHELALAAQVQLSFLPRSLPRLPGWGFATALQPAQIVSGDFFNIVPMPGSRVGILIADVVDKGVWAALFMAMSCALLRSALAESPDRPDLVLGEVNRQLLAYTSGEQFVTAFLGVLDPATGELHYASAGHDPPIWVSRTAGEEVALLARSGPPLGVFEDGQWGQERITLAPGDALVCYTDGVTEAEGASGGFFGIDRLVASVREASAAAGGADAVRDAILAAVRAFAGDAAPQADDIALITIVRDG